MLRCGIDLIEVARVRGALERHGERFRRRVFTAREIEYCAGKAHPWRPVDVEEMYRRAGLVPSRPHRLGTWLRRRFGPPFFFEPRAPRR